MKANDTTPGVLIESNKSWTVVKEGHQVHLTLNDIQQLLRRLVSAGELMVLDHGRGRGWSGHEIGLSINGHAIQIDLVGDPSPQVAERDREIGEIREGVLGLLKKKMATRKSLRAQLNASTEDKRTVLDGVLADLRAEGIIELSHGRFRLRQPRLSQAESPFPGDSIDDKAFLAELEAMSEGAVIP